MVSISEKFNSTFSKVTSSGLLLFIVMVFQFTVILATVCLAMDFMNKEPIITVAIICGMGAGWMIRPFMRNLNELRS